MSVIEDTGTLIEHAVAYALQGLEVFPCRPDNKAPLTAHGWKDATADTDQVIAWWRQHPDALIGCRIPKGHVLLDIDPKHGGHTTWAALKEMYDTLPPTRRHASGRGDGGGHTWWRHPGGKLVATTLNQWAEINGTGERIDHGDGRHRHISGIDILHHDHRYTILPPSPHPDTHLPYRWLGDGLDTPPAVMPGWLTHLLRPTETHTENTTGNAAFPIPLQPATTQDSIADWATQHLTWTALLTHAGWTCVQGDGNSDGSLWRHPNATNSHSASIKNNCLFIYTDGTVFQPTGEGDTHGYTKFRAYAELEHRGDMSSAASAMRQQRNPTDTTTTPETDEVLNINLPDDFWQARPALTHISQAAHSRIISRDAVLASVLARVAVTIPPWVTIPPIVGAPATFDYFAAAISRSGTGKSTSERLADELWPTLQANTAKKPLGSGEGLIEAYFGDVKVEGDDGKKRTEKQQILDGILFHLDEGQALNEVASRSGSTLFQTMRSAWSGAELGQTNASKERTRQLKAGQYRCVLVAGFQWSTAVPLIQDDAGGTPQRFLWLAGEDPSIPATAAERPEWPGPLTRRNNTWTRGHISIDQAITDQVVQNHIDRSRGITVDTDPLDAHRNLLRIKTAMLLSVLDDRRDINGDDWTLAGQILDTSATVRRRIISLAAQDARAKSMARTAAKIDEVTAIGDSEVTRATQMMAGAIARHVQRGGGPKCDPAGCTRRCVARSTAGKHRAIGSIEAAIDMALAEGHIIEQDGHLKPGRKETK